MLHISPNRIAAVLTLLIAAAIAYLSLNTSGGPPGLKISDKLLHFIAYFALAAPMTIWLGARRWLWALLICTAYGALLEYLQGASGLGRTASMLDGFANAAGAAFGCGAAWLLDKKGRPRA